MAVRVRTSRRADSRSTLANLWRMYPSDPNHSPAYRAFSWELVRVRKSVFTLLDVAQSEVVEPADDAANIDAPGIDAGFVKFISDSGRAIREDLSAVVRHNCTGAALQIVYPLFEAFVKATGQTPGLGICAGPRFGTSTFSELLWAGRNAFAHGDEWKRTSFAHHRAKESARILRGAGIEPEGMNLFDLYTLMSGGDASVFLDRTTETAKDLARRIPPIPVDIAALKTVAFVILGGVLLMLWAVTRQPIDGENDNGEGGVIMFAYQANDRTIMIPIAEGKIANPNAIASAIRSGAIARLSAVDAQPFRTLDALIESCVADFGNLLGVEYDDPSYGDRLIDLANRAERVKPMFDALPNPLTLLAAERGLHGIEEYTALVGEMLSDSNFAPMPFKEITPSKAIPFPFKKLS